MSTTFRTHVSLNARDLARSISFYTTLFGAPPSKTRQDYAKWDLGDPGLVLSLNAAPDLGAPESASLSHLGLRVETGETLLAEHARLAGAGVPILLEETGVTCCYAVQDKFWVHDPDGNAWEIYHFLEDAESHGKGGEVELGADQACTDQVGAQPASAGACCPTAPVGTAADTGTSSCC